MVTVHHNVSIFGTQPRARVTTHATTGRRTNGTTCWMRQRTRTSQEQTCRAGVPGTTRKVVCRAARPALVCAAATELKEIDKDNFEQVLRDAKEKLVVVDFYTTWCGPCKVIYPKLVELQNEMPDIELVKFNCNEYNKPLAKELGIRVAPTFKLYKNNTKVAEVTGAKVDVLKDLIQKHK